MYILSVPLRFPTLTNAIFVTQPNSSTVAATTTYTIVAKYLAGAIKATGTYIRLAVLAPVTGTGTLTTTYIGLAATSGNAWNFASTPTQITWDGGSTSKTLTSGSGVNVSDLIPFTVDDTKSILIAYDTPIGSQFRFASNLSSDYIAYTKPSVNEASTVSKGSGYTAIPSFSYFLQFLQVDT